MTVTHRMVKKTGTRCSVMGFFERVMAALMRMGADTTITWGTIGTTMVEMAAAISAVIATTSVVSTMARTLRGMATIGILLIPIV
jgi:hypothetical protein